MSDISLSKAVRSNLLSLQNTADLMAKTQNRLSTGNKVNSALDNPTNFFTASSLNSRAGDLNQLMDSMANGIQTLEAADNGLTAITKTLESMQSTLRQARQDKSFQTESYSLGTGLTDTDTIDFSGGSVGTPAVSIALGTAITGGSSATPSTFTGVGGAAVTAGTAGDIVVTVGTDTYTVTLADADSLSDIATKINSAVGSTVADGSGSQIVLTNAAGTGISVADASGNGNGTTAQAFGSSPTVVAGSPAVAGTGGTKSVDVLVDEINKHADLKGKIRASNDNGKLRIENLSTEDLTVAKPTGVTGETKIDGNTVRADLANQYNELRDQLDKLADDASFNGINLLRGDKLTITFNETGTSSIDISTKGEEAINSANLKISTWMNAADLDSDSNIDAELAKLKAGLNQVRSQASTFGSNLSIVQNRQDFTKNMINTLQTGAANLTLADMNEEAANLLALQTRQSLSSSSLSLASQADQSVLQLIR